jgi:hypothetical protein
MNYLKYGWVEEEMKSDLFGLTPFEIHIKLQEYFVDFIMSAFRIKYEDMLDFEFAVVTYGNLSYTEVQNMPFHKIGDWMKKVEEKNKKEREQEEKERAKYNMKDYNPNSMMKNAQKHNNFKQAKMPKYR